MSFWIIMAVWFSTMIIILIGCAIYAKVSDWHESKEYRAQRAKRIANNAADFVKQRKQEYASALWKFYRTNHIGYCCSVFITGEGLMGISEFMNKRYIEAKTIYDNNRLVAGYQYSITPKGIKLLQRFYGE